MMPCSSKCAFAKVFFPSTSSGFFVFHVEARSPAEKNIALTSVWKTRSHTKLKPKTLTLRGVQQCVFLTCACVVVVAELTCAEVVFFLADVVSRLAVDGSSGMCHHVGCVLSAVRQLFPTSGRQLNGVQCGRWWQENLCGVRASCWTGNCTSPAVRRTLRQLMQVKRRPQAEQWECT